MTHILAWTLEAFARSEDFRQSLLELQPAEADKVIWNRAWRGDDFQARFADAVLIYGSELATIALKAIDLENRQIEWIEVLLGRRSSSYYLEIASEAKRNGNPILNWATTQYAGLPPSAALAVAETLREKVWCEFKDERARRRFVFKEARHKDQKLDLMVLDCAGLPGLLHHRVDQWQRCGLPMIQESLDFATPVTDSSGISASETLLTVKEAIRESGLTLDAQRVMYARMQDYTREEAHMPFGMSKRRVAAAWRELNRKRDTFRRVLSPSRPPNCTLQ